MRTALVLAGGALGDVVAAPAVDTPLVVAADSGLHHADVLGLTVDVIVGDLDSADPARVDAAVRAGARLEQHPADKDATDLELALDCARRKGATEIVVLGAGGGRLDHLLGNLLLLAHPAWTGIPISAAIDGARVRVARGGEAAIALRGAPGSLVTLLPVGGAARGIVTDGLQYALAHEDLGPGTTRGVSNVMTGATASVALDDGTLLVVQPKEDGA